MSFNPQIYLSGFGPAVAEQVLMLFLIMGLGFLARKLNILTNPVKQGLTDLILKITLPLMIVASFNQDYSPQLLWDAGFILLISLAIHFGSYGLSLLLYRKAPADRRAVLRYFTVFSNAVFMGYAVLDALYGQTGVFYASIYMLPYRILMWTMGVALFTHGFEKSQWKQIYFNPAIFAVVVGLIAFVLNVDFPPVIAKTISTAGGITTPLAMMIVGSILADAKLRGVFDPGILFAGLFRLALIPLTVFFILTWLKFSADVIATSVILTAMPAGSFTAILASKYKANEVYASQAVFVTTLLSILTIPLIVLLL